MFDSIPTQQSFEKYFDIFISKTIRVQTKYTFHFLFCQSSFRPFSNFKQKKSGKRIRFFFLIFGSVRFVLFLFVLVCFVDRRK